MFFRLECVRALPYHAVTRDRQHPRLLLDGRRPRKRARGKHGTASAVQRIPHRFIAYGANPGLAALLTEAVGPGWVADMDRLRGLEVFAADAAFQAFQTRFCSIVLK